MLPRPVLVSIFCAFTLPLFAVTDTVPAAHFTINGTPGFDAVTISDGPGQTTTVSSPSFESITFGNKTNVVFDGLGGGDTVKFSNPNPPAGLVSLIVQNVTRIEQISPVRYRALGLDAADEVVMHFRANDVDRIEITAGRQITFADSDDVVIGGVSSALSGIRTADGILSLTTVTGDITLSDTDAAEVIYSGVVTLEAGRDLTMDVDRHAIVSSWGDTSLHAGRDVVLGKGGYANDVRASGAALLRAERAFKIAGRTTILGNVTETSITAMSLGAGSWIEQRDDATFIAAGTSAQMIVGTTALYLRGNVYGLQSLGSMFLLVRDLEIDTDFGILAPRGTVRIWAEGGAHLGTAVDVAGAPVELSDEELDAIETPGIIVGVQFEGDSVEVTGPITLDKKLQLESTRALTSSGSGRVEAPELVISTVGSEPVRWTITPHAVQWDDAAPIPYSGVATLSVLGAGYGDTFEVTPSETTRIHVYGYGPDPGPAAGDTLDVDLDGVADPVLHATLHPNYGYQGTLTSSNRNPVLFWNIESFEHAPVNLRVLNTDRASRVAVGERVTYTVTIHNYAAIAVANAQVVDVVPPQLLDVQWTCVPSAGSNCNAVGRGDVRDTVDLAAGGSVTYSISGTTSQIGTLTNTATVTTSGDYFDLDAANNTATDVTTVVAELPQKPRVIRRR